MVSCPNHITLREKKCAWKEMLLGNTCRGVFMVFIILFGVLYVLKTSSLSAKGCEISDLEKQIQVLQNENQKLDFEIAANSSMKSIEKRLKNMNLVVADKVEYATLVSNAMARR